MDVDLVLILSNIVNHMHIQFTLSILSTGSGYDCDKRGDTHITPLLESVTYMNEFSSMFIQEECE